MLAICKTENQTTFARKSKVQIGRQINVPTIGSLRSVVDSTFRRSDRSNRSSISRSDARIAQVGRRFHIPMLGSLRSVVDFMFRRLDRSGRSSISRSDARIAQIGRRFHVPTLGSLRSVVDFTIWRTEDPKRSSILPKGGKGSAKGTRKDPEAEWIHCDDLSSRDEAARRGSAQPTRPSLRAPLPCPTDSPEVHRMSRKCLNPMHGRVKNPKALAHSRSPANKEAFYGKWPLCPITVLPHRGILYCSSRV
jgi:hypothetical protein